MASSRGAPFMQFTFRETLPEGLDRWARDLPYPDNNPSINHNGTPHVIYWGGPNSAVEPGQLVMHPGLPESVAVLRWVAPAAGKFRVLATWVGNSGDCGGNSSAVDVAVLAAGTEVYSADINGRGSRAHADLCLNVRQGDALDFAVGNGPGQNHFCDHAGTDVTIQTIAVCPVNCDDNCTLDIFDFLCFQNRFAALDPYACDCDTSSGPLVCDIFDFLCFQNAFAAGCP